MGTEGRNVPRTGGIMVLEFALGLIYLVERTVWTSDLLPAIFIELISNAIRERLKRSEPDAKLM